MNGNAPDWGGGSRFYLPNEDAAVVCAAVELFGNRPRRPVFVGGSGMTLLEAAGALPRLETATFVDVADFQFEYFRLLLRALDRAASPDMLRSWFGRIVYPELHHHHLLRGREYSLQHVLAALRDIFGIRFLFDQDAFDRARSVTGRTAAVRTDIASYLARTRIRHDFIYLSNVPDYLDETALKTLFAACRVHKAPVYLLLTSACPDPGVAQWGWEEAGFVTHPDTPRLNSINRGLGSPELRTGWNRPGTIHLLVQSHQRRHTI